MTLPATETLLLGEDGPFLHITLHRPESRNAMSLTMVNELMTVFDSISKDDNFRAVILRGSNGHFCAGGDIKDMAGARMKAASGESDAYFQLNRRFGEMITLANQLPQVLVTVIEGAVLGGGFGLACISDVAIAAENAQFGLPETGLGVIPAQIAPFVVQRIGLTQARRLALTGARFSGAEAARLGIVHEAIPAAELDARLDVTLKQIRRCAPHANRITKQLVLSVGQQPLEELLDQAARDFAAAVASAEGAEGTMAFVQKRLPNWAE
ncbi:enoyl-CoA hydratase/isomerase family protein [Alcanivorax sp. 1008]|uniref:enoyl-CoA hydratase/isomerase family protein n=1 Tax=Alcanivorax sp. 1008 TaxID=2816853 RepID=UPI001D98DC55|nr:enoyl-CoA hydratase-related protein [Alcanivorax sp. 1008]MCC1497164.1 enoyl-CoA hydratase/isomerase family protein [Alcanivorax sp. 1008]